MGACKAAAILHSLEPDDAATLARALADPAVPASILSRALHLERHPIGPTTVKDHRAGRCACTR